MWDGEVRGRVVGKGRRKRCVEREERMRIRGEGDSGRKVGMNVVV